MNDHTDRLYDLLPAVYRMRDADRGYPLRALLHVIAEQVNVVDRDIAQLYENWFIETCQDWVVPYIGDLIGYTPVQKTGEPVDVATASGIARSRILVPRREVVNTIRYRRRKGTVKLLETLAFAVVGWPARAVEFHRLLGVTQNINCLRLDRGRTVDLRNRHALTLVNRPFDPAAHTIDVRGVSARSGLGRYSIPSVGLFVWRLRSYPISYTQTSCIDRRLASYTFSILGNDVPLFARTTSRTTPNDPTGTSNLPVPIRRVDFELRDGTTVRANPAYYGPGKSLEIWTGSKPVAIEAIVPADLSRWQYRPQQPGQVAVDPERGRIAFDEQPEGDVLVSYHYGFSTEMGGGEYQRSLIDPARDAETFRVKTTLEGEPRPPAGVYRTLTDALTAAAKSTARNVVVEICDSGLYQEHVSIVVPEDHSFQIRAARGKRPVILIPDDRAQRDTFGVKLSPGARFMLDGVVVAARAMRVRGPQRDAKPGQVIIRHSTLVPGWLLDAECEPSCTEEPSLEIDNARCCIRIEHSICGSVFINNDEGRLDPIPIHISDSIIDATNSRFLPEVDPDKCRTFHAISHEKCGLAHAVLTILRSTIIGDVRAHAIELADNTIFYGLVIVARRQIGCVRFCYVPHDSRTPRRYECQPDLVEKAISDRFLRRAGKMSVEERDTLQESERLRVAPVFNSIRYGTPTYCQLAEACAEEITRGADDESEMGVFHDLYQPQREANLRARLAEYTPAGMDAGIIRAN